VKGKKLNASPRTLLVVAVVVPLLAAALGWFVLVSPKRAEVARLDAEIADVQLQVSQRRGQLARPVEAQAPASADLFRLTKAMPDAPDMAGVLLELNQIAADSGIVFESIAPQAAPAGGDYQSLPVQVTFQGTFYNLSDFLLRLRRLVKVRDGELDARGRLFVVDSLAFAESESGFPRIQATLTVKAFVFGSTPLGTVPPAAAEGAAPEDGAGEDEAPAPAEPSAPPAGDVTAAGAQ
jgi:Tfp pilus assembly protein PilO